MLCFLAMAFRPSLRRPLPAGEAALPLADAERSRSLHDARPAAAAAMADTSDELDLSDELSKLMDEHALSEIRAAQHEEQVLARFRTELTCAESSYDARVQSELATQRTMVNVMMEKREGELAMMLATEQARHAEAAAHKEQTLQHEMSVFVNAVRGESAQQVAAAKEAMSSEISAHFRDLYESEFAVEQQHRVPVPIPKGCCRP